MYEIGKHYLVEVQECDSEILKDVKIIEEILLEAARLARATIVASSFHTFSPYGVSGVIIIAESHITIHTWPEYKYAAIDIFTCSKDIDSDAPVSFIVSQLKAKKTKLLFVSRGLS